MVRLSKKIFSLLLVSFILLGLTTNIVLADTKGEAVIASSKVSVSNKLAHFCKSFCVNQTNEDEIIYLNGLMNFNIWFRYATQSNSLGFTPNNLSTYYDFLKKSVLTFNNSYSSVDDTRASLKLNISIDESQYSDLDLYKTYSKLVMDELISKTKEQIIFLFNEIAKDISGKKDEDKEKILGENADVILACYRLIERVTSEYTLMSNIASKVPSDSIPKIDLDPLSNLLIDNKYKDIFEYAKSKVQESIINSDIIKSSDGDSPELRFQSKDTYDGEEKLYVNRAFLACVAASSIYRPFSSKIMGDDFFNAIKYIAPDNYKQIIDDYKKLAGRKKPLFKVKVNSELKPTGGASKISLGDFVKSIEDQSEFGLVSFKGKLVQDQDSTFFYEDDGTKINEKTGDKVTEEEEEDKEENKDNKDNNKPVETVVDEEDRSNSAGAQFEDEEGNRYNLIDGLNDTDKMTDVYFWTGENGGEIASVSESLIRNCILDNKEDLDNSSIANSTLFINPFGDIVLSDNTVIVPASANPCFYESKDKLYYPGTVAFMNHYPNITMTNNRFEEDDNNNNKEIVAGEYADGLSDEYKDRVKNSSYLDPSIYYNQNVKYPSVDMKTNGNIMSLISKDGIKWGQLEDKYMGVELEAYNSGSDKVKLLKAVYFDYNLTDTQAFHPWHLTFIPANDDIIINGTRTKLFPIYSSSEDCYQERCNLVTQMWYNSMTVDSETGESKLYNGRLDIGKFTDMFQETCKGSGSDSAVYDKNSKKTYDDEDSSSFLTNVIASADEKLLDVFGSNNGVVGIKNAYQNSILYDFIHLVDRFFPYLITVVGVIMVILFATKRYNLTAIFFNSLKVVLFVTLFAKIIPVYIPTLLNGLIDNYSDDIGYKALTMREEEYINAYNVSSKITQKGYTLESSSVNIFKLNKDDSAILKRYGLTDDKLKIGEPLILDSDTGLFAEGEHLKFNLDRLLETYVISGKGVDDKDDYTSNYILTCNKVKSSVMDYYTPYSGFIDSLINKLNKFSTVFKLPRSAFNYGNNFYKDAFLVKTYFKSDLVMNYDSYNEDNEIKRKYNTDVYENMIAEFGETNIDFLGLSEIFYDKVENNIDKIKDTLWFNTMKQNGYYNEDNSPNSEKIDRMIVYVNRETREFLANNYGQLSFISDDNLIKITSLFALCQYDIEVSKMGNVLYPQGLNYEELNLKDVLLPVITKDYNRYTAVDRNLVSYIKTEFGFFGVLLFMFIIIIAWIITTIVQMAVPVLYIALIVCFILRIFLKKDERVKPVVLGYIKIFGTIFISYLLFCLSTTLIYKVNSSTVSLLLLLIIYAFLLSIMSFVIYCLVTNFLDFGSTKVNSTLSNIKDRLSSKITSVDWDRIRKPNIRNLLRRQGTEGNSGNINFDELFGDSYDQNILDFNTNRRYYRNNNYNNTNYTSVNNARDTNSHNHNRNRRVEYDDNNPFYDDFDDL